MGLLDWLFGTAAPPRRARTGTREIALRAYEAELRRAVRQDLARLSRGEAYGRRAALVTELARRHGLSRTAVSDLVTGSRALQRPAALPGRIDDTPTRPLPREAVRAARRAHERGERSARERSIQELARAPHRFSRAEAERFIDRTGMPGARERNPSARSSLRVAAEALRERGRTRNPFLSELAGGAAIGVVAGIVTPIASELIGTRALERQLRRRHRNPAVLAPGADARLERISERFHGTGGEVVRLGPDQRRVPPELVVRVGEEVATAYRPSRRSRRGGTDWEHQAGDQGDGRPRARGRRLIVADAEGRTYVVPGTSRMQFDADQGLIG